jgi:hypothetical protein
LPVTFIARAEAAQQCGARAGAARGGRGQIGSTRPAKYRIEGRPQYEAQPHHDT